MYTLFLVVKGKQAGDTQHKVQTNKSIILLCCIPLTRLIYFFWLMETNSVREKLVVPMLPSVRREALRQV